MPSSTQILKSVGKTINLAKPQVYQVPRKPPLNSLVFEKLPEPRCGDRIAIDKPPTPKPVRVCTKEELQAMYCCPCPCDCKTKTRLTTAQKIVSALILVAKSAVVGALVYYTWAEGLWSDSEHSRCIYDKLTTPKKCNHLVASFICLLVKQAAKGIFIYEMTYYTWKEGIWSDAFHSSCYLNKFVEYCPEVKEDPENEYSSDGEISIPDPEPCLPFIPRSDFMLYTLSNVWNKSVINVFWMVLDGPMEFWHFIVSLFTPKPIIKDVDPCDEVRARKR